MQKRTYSIVGINHTGKEAFVEKLATGHPVVLVREPDNKFDKRAIAVYVDGERVGYIPRNQNSVLSGFIDQTGQPWTEPAKMATDGNALAAATWDKTIPGRFVRSPNSAFPLVEV